MLKSIDSFIKVRRLRGIRASVSDLCGARSQSRWQILDVSKTRYSLIAFNKHVEKLDTLYYFLNPVGALLGPSRGHIGAFWTLLEVS